MAQQSLKCIHPADKRHREPFRVVIISNPCLVSPTGKLVEDPIATDEAVFKDAVDTIFTALFGRQKNQAELFLGTEGVEDGCEVYYGFLSGYPLALENAFVQEQPNSDIIAPRREEAAAAVRSLFGFAADLIFAVTWSATHNRDAAFAATDHVGRGGVPFVLDGMRGLHCFYSRIPGTVAFYATSDGMTALHEAGHAIGSFENGEVTDLYVDSSSAVNVKRGRPIPVSFGTLDGVELLSDPTRDGIGYDAGWWSYHCELHDPAFPAIMDDYYHAQDRGGIERCQHDKITRQFLLDRIRAKIARGETP